ncbi:MAG: LysR family carnitine catabolism transcriptional activator [Paracoccaceae bacterium]|jgi:LysR family carnitine catabolism transcriptional activator
MAIKIEMLRCFSIVAQTGNLSEAATRLGRTQSAISMTLKQLEEHLGQRLFESDRKNRLTTLGEQVFELARTELRQFDETVRAIETSAISPQWLIRIVAVPSIASIVFPVIAKDFNSRWPRINIELRDADSLQAVDILMRGQADIGIASPQAAMNGIVQTPLFSDPFGLICAVNHPLAQQIQTPTLRQVLSSNFVRNDLCLSIGDSSFQEATTNAKLTARNTLSLISLVRSGSWITILPQAVAKILPDDLMFREISDLQDRRQVNLFLRQKNPFFRYAKEMSDVISETDWGFEQSPAHPT